MAGIRVVRVSKRHGLFVSPRYCSNLNSVGRLESSREPQGLKRGLCSASSWTACSRIVQGPRERLPHHQLPAAVQLFGSTLSTLRT